MKIFLQVLLLTIVVVYVLMDNLTTSSNIYVGPRLYSRFPQGMTTGVRERITHNPDFSRERNEWELCIPTVVVPVFSVLLHPVCITKLS